MTAAPPASGRGTALHPVPVTARTTWLLVRQGPGWGELSDIPEEEAARILASGAPLHSGFAGRTVAGGLATAAADAAARAAGRPLADWLADRTAGTVHRRTLPLYANINRAVRTRNPDAAAAVAARAVAAGFGTVKIAPWDALTGPDRIAEGLRIARAVRDAIGEDRRLLLDAHHLLTVDELLVHADALAELRPGWLEDTAQLHDPQGLRKVRDALGVPLAGGEFAATEDEVLPALRSGALDVLMPDVKHAGGPQQVLRLAGLAERHGVAVSLHNPSGPVATAASAHLSALLAPSSPPLEFMFGEVAWRAETVTPHEPVAAGTYTLPPGPGLGLVPDLSHRPEETTA
ncbi:enolase C-terminal domain-like protein [Streptomyces indicus]|uniref:Galactonate dehydratase n=1 Tax=Streptomyces indicus TaxID=417292 RepID=A0A1G9IJ92_9ACTN|nr:enolase C-terminal domain-like protein [Streptomyces indicus]SDL25298.1 galactonate dehydratase [Streptomyces indicus]